LDFSALSVQLKLPPRSSDDITLTPQEAEHRFAADLEPLDMAGLPIVRRLEMDMDVAVAGGKDAAMAGRVKADNSRLDLLQSEPDLDLPVRLHVMRRNPDAIEDMELD
jgi:hypothetical protein